MLSVHNLSKSFGDTVVLDALSLEIFKGEFIGIVGPSGCGKTTLLSILATLDRPDSGEYAISDHNILDLSDDALAMYRNSHFGFVFQSSNLMMNLSVSENIALPFYYGEFTPSKVISQRVSYLLGSVGLHGYENKKANLLSGGEQQRVAIARALSKNPDIIFADEPTGNLDAGNTVIILEYLRSLCRNENKTVIMVTHDSFASQYCSRIIELPKYVS
jgi:putative ABC transport system ATP-binding protein